MTATPCTDSSTLLALLQRAARQAVDPDGAALAVVERLVGQQRGHAEPGVGGQHAELCGQLRVEAVLAVELLGEFLGGLVAEGVADDHEDPAVRPLRQHGRHFPLIECLLIGHAVDPPQPEQAGLQVLVPLQRQLGDEAVAVDLLDLLAQGLEDVPVARLRVVRGLAEMPVELVEAIQPAGVGPEQRLRVRVGQATGDARCAGQRDRPRSATPGRPHTAPDAGRSGCRAVPVAAQ